MRILIDILHPAHVHFFKNFIWQMQKKGHTIFITSRDKDLTLKLLDKYNLPHVQISTQKKGRLGLLFELIDRNKKFIQIAKRFKPHFTTGIMGATIGTTNRKVPSKAVVFYDTEIAGTNRFVYPRADYVCTPACYKGRVKSNHIKYDGYHELAYLYPGRFKPDESVLDLEGLEKGEPFFIVRFVSWQSVHDVGDYGVKDQVAFIKELEKFGRPIITTEGKIPKELDRYQSKVPVHKIHDLMAFANLYIGESATMASEAAVLGVPSIFISQQFRGYIDEQQKDYELSFHFNDPKQAMEKALEIVNTPNYKKLWKQKQKKMLSDKIDVTKWMVWFFEDEYDKIYTRWQGV